ncbi:MAG: hypothetical protein H6832_06965 [Planctomycetes bacterium]|nr:hypothetical protein [Planctomycetota bacterium]MCB9918128.1 hypothetical protein [Planctomycetota bacterium]
MALTLGCVGFTGCSGTADLRQDPLGTNATLESRIDAESGETLQPVGYVAPARNAAARGAGAQGDGQGGQDSPLEQRRAFLVQQNLNNARRARELNLWNDVRIAAAAALELDDSNEEARQLLQEAQSMLGDRVPTIEERAKDYAVLAQVEKQRDLFRARDFERKGDLLSEQKEYAEAEQAFERARLTLVYSPWFTPDSEDQRRIDAKIARARDDQVRWARERDQQDAQKTRAELAEVERAAREKLARRVSELYIQANLAFQKKRYDRAVELLDEALRLDPLNDDAKDLRELASRAQHDSRMDRLDAEWRQKWTETIDDLKHLDIPQVDPIAHDVRHWLDDVRHRKPLAFTGAGPSETEDTSELAKILESTVIDHDFGSATLSQWVDYYRRGTGLTFVVTPKAGELGEEESSLTNFKLGKKSVRAALDLIARIKPLKWRIKDGVVQIQAKDEGGAKVRPVLYEVREIVNPLAQHPGRDIKIKVGEGEDFGSEEEEPLPNVVDADKLQELIRNNVGEEGAWDIDGATMEPIGNALMISQTDEMHRRIEKLLRDLRSDTGLQVSIEARFLRVEDNFLEEVGVDFRGLGNQANEGKPGMGLQKLEDRSGFRFDDYGTNTSPSDPGIVGSGFEPGIFFNDGGDGDLYGRTENLFNRVLGGGEEGLSNAGGLAFQWTYLDDTELEIVLRAVQKEERVQEISAPHLLVHNTARANIAVNRQFSYIRDFNVEIAQAAAVADPIVDVIRDGVVLDVRPVVSADRKFILLELRPTVANLALPIPTFTTSLSVGQPVTMQLPRLTLQKVRTTVIVPDGGTLLLGGMKMVQKQDFDSGVPILKDLPGLSFFFSRKGTYRANKKILILLHTNIVVPREWEPQDPTDLGR